MMPRPKAKSRYGLAAALAVAASLFFISFGLIFIVNKIINFKFSTPKEVEYAKIYQYFSGNTKPTKTLIIFANNAEQRFGGGFLGSYAILEGKNGKFKMSEVSNIYNIDYDTINEKLGVPVPEYMKFLAPYLSLRDSGIYHSWPANAQNAMRFYQADTGQSVDNVVEITPQVLKALLKQTGPVTLKDYNLTVTDANFLETVQLEVEAGKDKIQGKDPKNGILTALAQVLMQRLAQQDINSLRHYGNMFDQLAAQKNIIIYSSDKDIQKSIKDLGLAGEIKQTDYNYFQITEANFGADKSSPYVRQIVNYDQIINSDGTSTITATVSRNHTSDYKFPYVNPYTNKSDWLIKTNNSKIDIILPKDTKLENVSGVNKYQQTISEEQLIVSYISDLAPLGPAQNVTIKYKIPQLYDISRTITVNTLVQKQNGGWPYEMIYTLNVPAGYHIIATNNQIVDRPTPTSARVHATISTDTIFSFVYEKDQQ
jgi:hypothetical protein